MRVRNRPPVKAQAQQNLLTDQHNPNKAENALLVNLYEGESALNSATRAE